jgi:hypothetical protein
MAKLSEGKTLYLYEYIFMYLYTVIYVYVYATCIYIYVCISGPNCCLSIWDGQTVRRIRHYWDFFYVSMNTIYKIVNMCLFVICICKLHAYMIACMYIQIWFFPHFYVCSYNFSKQYNQTERVA